MNRLSKKNSATIGFMTLFAIVILVFYYYWTTRTDPISETEVKELTEYQKIMSVDLDQNYPATPREVTKLFGRMIKFMYDNPKEDEIKPVALKVRELYDNEFLADNPEERYLKDLISDIASWKEKSRRITNYLMVNDELEKDSEIDGIKYSVKYIAYTIKEKGKFTETWRVLLRQDETEKWRVLGWEFVPADDNQKDK